MTRYPDIHLYVGGEWRRAAAALPVVNPSNETVIGTVPVADRAAIDAALQAAEEGFRLWRATSPSARAAVLVRAASLLRERADAIARDVSLEQGKPLAQARLETLRAADFFEWDAAEGQRLYGRIIPGEAGIRYLVLRQPIGAVAAFSPWNFPVSQPARKIGAALAAGCSIVIKAAEETPAGAMHLVGTLHDAGLPRGVVNLVFGVPADISTHLIQSPFIRLLAFTGSTAVGKTLAGLAACHMKPALMELGGHGPVIVCADADIPSAARACAIQKARNAGQVCTAPTRFYVEEPAYEAFLGAFVEEARRIRLGHGLDPSSGMGPLANPRRVAAMETLVADGVRRGARPLLGGERPAGPGYYYPLTVLAEVPDDARAMREEPFGPLALVNPVASLDEAIGKANSLPYGLSAYAFTRSAYRADRLADGIEAGSLSINTLVASTAETPFGGVKESGYGREGGAEGLHNYTVVKTVTHLMVE